MLLQIKRLFKSVFIKRDMKGLCWCISCYRIYKCYGSKILCIRYGKRIKNNKFCGRQFYFYLNLLTATTHKI